jgi:hypothetical protein
LYLESWIWAPKDGVTVLANDCNVYASHIIRRQKKLEKIMVLKVFALLKHFSPLINKDTKKMISPGSCEETRISMVAPREGW